MLDNELKTQLKAYLERLQQPIELIASLDDSAAAAQMRELLNEIAAQSALITVSDAGDDARRPSFVIRRTGTDVQVRFAGLPMGHEFTSLVRWAGIRPRPRPRSWHKLPPCPATTNLKSSFH